MESLPPFIYQLMAADAQNETYPNDPPQTVLLTSHDLEWLARSTVYKSKHKIGRPRCYNKSKPGVVEKRFVVSNLQTDVWLHL